MVGNKNVETDLCFVVDPYARTRKSVVFCINFFSEYKKRIANKTNKVLRRGEKRSVFKRVATAMYTGKARHVRG